MCWICLFCTFPPNFWGAFAYWNWNLALYTSFTSVFLVLVRKLKKEWKTRLGVGRCVSLSNCQCTAASGCFFWLFIFLFLLHPPSLCGLWLILLLFQYSNVENVTCQRAAFDLWFNCHLPTISKWESLWENFCVTNSCYNLDIYNCEYDQIVIKGVVVKELVESIQS